MMIDLTKTATHLEFGQMIGVSRQAVTAMVRDGALTPGATAGEWLHAYCARLREQAAGRMGRDAVEGLDLVAERALLTRAQREATEMKNAETRKELIRVSEIGPVWARALTTMRDRLLLLPDRLAPVLAAATDPRVCRSALDQELRSALTDLAEGVGAS